MRKQHGVELQTFGLVYGQHPYALLFARGDGLLAQHVVPFGKEGMQVVGVVLQIVLHSIQEGIVIGLLLGEHLQVQPAVEFLHQFVQRHLLQPLPFLHQKFGQHVQCIGAHDTVHGHVRPLHPLHVVHQEQVVGQWLCLVVIYQQAHGRHQYRGYGTVAQQVCLVAGYAYALRSMLVEILQYGGGIVVLSEQYGHLFQWQACLVQSAYLL